jgi:hypothetical protein
VKIKPGLRSMKSKLDEYARVRSGNAMPTMC